MLSMSKQHPVLQAPYWIKYYRNTTFRKEN